MFVTIRVADERHEFGPVVVVSGFELERFFLAFKKPQHVKVLLVALVVVAHRSGLPPHQVRPRAALQAQPNRQTRIRVSGKGRSVVVD
jgi:hypothetical protein